MFDGVARRYDLTNTVLSLGQDRYWRRATRLALSIGSGEKVLDLAAGTAVSTVELAMLVDAVELAPPLPVALVLSSLRTQPSEPPERAQPSRSVR